MKLRTAWRWSRAPRLTMAWSVLAGSLTFATTSGAEGVLDPSGPIAAAEKTILLNAVAIMLTIIVPVILATLGVAWWYRASNAHARYLPSWSYSGKVEIVVWSIPAMVILLLGGVAWIGSHDLDPARPIATTAKPIEIEVVALDWKWLFLYPEKDVASVNRMVIPAGTPVSLRLTSATVMNSFFVPQLAGQIYTMAGMTTRLHFVADHAGQYRGLSSQFSGDGFSGMRFVVDAVSQEEFDGWASATHAKGPALDAAAYAALAKPSSYVPPATYGGVSAGLFDAIAGLKLSARDERRSGTTEISAALPGPICASE